MSDFETRAEVSAYYQGMTDGAGEYEREYNTRKAYHAILTDLITELRDLSDNRALRLDLADWAEDRLREAFDSNVYGSIALGEVYGDE